MDLYKKYWGFIAEEVKDLDYVIFTTSQHSQPKYIGNFENFSKKFLYVHRNNSDNYIPDIETLLKESKHIVVSPLLKMSVKTEYILPVYKADDLMPGYSDNKFLIIHNIEM